MHSTTVVTSHSDKYRFQQPDVLVVDDDPDIQTILRDLLESEGYAITDASTCREALRQAQTISFAAVLLDIELPDGDGLSLFGQLQKMIPALPVILLTAAASSELHSHSLSLGAFSFVAKPYNHRELCHLVRQAIGTPGKALPEAADSAHSQPATCRSNS